MIKCNIKREVFDGTLLSVGQGRPREQLIVTDLTDPTVPALKFLCTLTRIDE